MSGPDGRWLEPLAVEGSAGPGFSPSSDSSQSGVRCGQGPSVRETGSPCGQQRDTACGVTCPHCVHVLLFRLNKLDAS